MDDLTKLQLTRRDLLKVGALSTVGLAAGGTAFGLNTRSQGHEQETGPGSQHDMVTVGELKSGSFDPTAYLGQFDTGRVSTLPGGQTLREYDLLAADREIEVAPGVFYPGWTYNGSVPGPTIRCTEGDRVRIHFRNEGSHAHTVHFHGIHPAKMDGAFEPVQPGQSYIYEFDALPFGLHLYHCHTVPIKRHIHKGLYGVFLIDPRAGRAPAHEMVMTMNAFDTNFDFENEIYAVNTVAFHYMKHPIQVKLGELVRIYLVNITEFDLLNSFHLHGNFFKLFRTGTNLEHYEYTDTVSMGQGERAVLEFTYEYPGLYMFHAHQSEFAELGWSGIFSVKADAHA
jgi:FtsP/CotA-like multicopper oxidase with cupredoxin domain